MSLKALTRDSIQQQAEKYLEGNAEPGNYIGFECLRDLYSHKRGTCTDWTGAPASGKTYYCLETLFNLSEKYGERHGLYVPDIGSDKDVIAKLVKMHCGKDYSDKFGNKITKPELSNALDWILYHFIIFGKEDFKKGITPILFWETICDYKDGGGILHNGLIDSWKNMSHIYGGREDSYLDEILSTRNEMAEKYNKHFHTIAHAVKTETIEQKGKRRIPNAWDIKGGGSWFANGKNIVTVDFPDKNKFGVDLYISKVKPEDVGRVGEAVGTIFLDPKRGRYYETAQLDILGVKYFAFEMEKGVAIQKLQELPF